ncbi:MAG: hypothetical protein KatS3mg034_1053 [Vicingaceae bacterium]|nr:MAG: hypothetical protein KatS3mg034_1053 [Vicingaceae bacterium]
MKNFSKFITGIIALLNLNFGSSQNALNVRFSTKAPRKISYISTLGSFKEIGNYYVNNYISVTNSAYLFKMHKENLEGNEIKLDHTFIEKTIYKQTKKILKSITYGSAQFVDENTIECVYSYIEDDKSGDKVNSVVVFKLNDKKECIYFKKLYKLPVLVNFIGLRGNILSVVHNQDKSKICIINSIPNKDGQISIDVRIFDTKDYNLIETKQAEIPIKFKNTNVSLISFKSLRQKKNYLLYTSISLQDENKKWRKGFLIFSFKENENFSPKILFVETSDDEYDDEYVDISSGNIYYRPNPKIIAPDLSSEFNASVYAILYKKVNNSNEKEIILKQIYLDFENDKIHEPRIIPLNHNQSYPNKFNYVYLKCFNLDKDKSIVLFEGYVDKFTSPHFSISLDLIENGKINNLLNYSINPRNYISPKFYFINESFDKFILLLPIEKYKSLMKKLAINNFKKQPTKPKNTGIEGLGYFIVDTKGDYNFEFFTMKNPQNNKNIDIEYVMYVTKNNDIILDKILTISSNKKYISFIDILK